MAIILLNLANEMTELAPLRAHDKLNFVNLAYSFKF